MVKRNGMDHTQKTQAPTFNLASAHADTWNQCKVGPCQDRHLEHQKLWDHLHLKSHSLGHTASRGWLQQNVYCKQDYKSNANFRPTLALQRNLREIKGVLEFAWRRISKCEVKTHIDYPALVSLLKELR